MPAKGKSKITDHQRHTIAAGKLAGKTSKQIACETGLHPCTIDHQVRDDRTITLAVQLKEKHRGDFERMYALSVKRMEKAIKHKDEGVSRAARAQMLRFLD